MPANVQTMFSGSGVVPWHKKGVVLEGLLTSEEAIKAAGLDWTVSKRKIYVNRGPNQMLVDRPEEDFFAITRDDNEVTLGIVGQQQAVLQNRNAFALLDQIVGEKLALYETAGALGKGERVWMLLKLPGILRVGGDDTIEKYLLCCHGHDGSLAFYLFETGVRVVCQNTLTMALQQRKGEGIKIKHTIKAMKNLTADSLRERLGLAHQNFGVMEGAARVLASKRVGVMEMMQYLQMLWPKPEEGYGPRTQTMLEEIEKLFDGGQRGADMPTVKGTAWGLFNAVAEYVDFHRPSKNTRNNTEDQNRTASILFGSARDVKQRAWTAALELAGR